MDRAGSRPGFVRSLMTECNSRGSFNSIDINFLGNYRAGLPSGVVWSRVRGGAWIVGQTDDQGDLTGENIAYLYPDFSTAIFGEFRKGMLVRGKAARVTGISFIEGVLWPKFTVESSRCH